MSPSQGRPPALTSDLDELLVLTYSALESTNVERWALEFGAPDPPVLRGTLRNASYETDVVGNIHRLGQRYWLQRKESAVWERPFHTGSPGRPPAVDIALFSDTNQREVRLEFGLYSSSGSGALTKKKLAGDAKGLHEQMGVTEPNYPQVENYVILWHETRSHLKRATMTEAARKEYRRKFAEHARTVTAEALSYEVDFLRCAGGPLFTPRGEYHWVIVALFAVICAETV